MSRLIVFDARAILIDPPSVSSPYTREADWDAVSYNYFWELAKNVPEAGVHVQSKSSIVDMFRLGK